MKAILFTLLVVISTGSFAQESAETKRVMASIEKKLQSASYTWCSYTQAVKALSENGWRKAKEYYPSNYKAQEAYSKKYDEKWWALLNKKIGLTKQEGQLAYYKGLYLNCI